MKQYILNSDGTSKELTKLTKDKIKKEKIEYDDIVDRSHYVTNKETIRQTRITSDTSGGQTPVYDDHEPTQLEIALRSGKLDKADVHQLQLKMQEEIKTGNEKAKAEALEKARQDYLDKATGFISEAQK